MNPVAITRSAVVPDGNRGPVALEAPRGNDLPASGKSSPPAPNPDNIARAVQQIQSFLSSTQRQLEFQLHEGSGRTVMKVLNPQTGELIRQIPAEEVLALAEAMRSQGGRLISELA